MKKAILISISKPLNLLFLAKWILIWGMVSSCGNEKTKPDSQLEFNNISKLQFKKIRFQEKMLSPDLVKNLTWNDLGKNPFSPEKWIEKKSTKKQFRWKPICSISFSKLPARPWLLKGKTSVFAKERIYFPGKKTLISSLPTSKSELYGVFSLTSENGLPGTAVQCLLNDKSGRIWMGTDNGLALYSGTRMEVFSTENGLPNNFISCLLQLQNGSIAIGTKAGFCIFDGQSFITIDQQSGLNSNWVTALGQKNEQIWIGTDNGINIFENGQISFVEHTKNQNEYKVSAIQKLSSNKIAVAYEGKGLELYENSSSTAISVSNGFISNNITSILETESKELWIGTLDSGPMIIRNDSLYAISNPESGIEKENVYQILEDKNNQIWLAGFNNGLYKFSGQEILENINSQHGILSNQILSLLETEDEKLLIGAVGGVNVLKLSNIKQYLNKEILLGDIPIGLGAGPDSSLLICTMFGGLNQWKANQSRSVTTKNGLSSNNVFNFAFDKNNRTYLATSGAGLDILDRNFVLNLGEKQGLKSLNVNAVLVSGKQEVFIGTNEAGLYKWDGKQLFNYGPIQGFSNNSIYNLSEDEKGRIWVGTNGDGLVLLDGNKILSLNPSNGLISNVVYPIIHKNNKSYFGTYGGGLYVLEGEKLANLKESDGLANNSVLSLALDNSGNVLCGTGKGLSIIHFKGNSFHCQTITKRDGLAFDDFNAYAGVTCGGIPYFGAGNSLIEIGAQSLRDTLPIRANFGQIYFGSDLILNPFQEVFKSILLKNSSVRLPETVGNEVVELPYSRNEVNFEFGYSAKSFQQSAVEFAYKLEGYDADWKISTSKTEQAFNGLPAGSYKFLLKAKASNQIWSTPISFSFNISSPWWEKWWFRLLELLAVFAGIYGLIQLRTRTLVQQKMKLEAVVEERTAEIVSQKEIIEKEKDKSEELLLNILPVDIADELKNTGRSEARRFENVTILFTDFKDFTKISEGLSPEELVKEIDFCFRAFDEITAKFGVEKIKTIGDAYMAAGGLPKTNLSHPIDVVNAGLEIVAFMAAYKEKRQAIGLESFEIRIGIHTGPVVAGIVGTRKFAYDIWGDTVNLASRMESSGEPGKINISSVTYGLVKNQFECSYRGKIKAKNKGEVDMYFVEKRI